MTISRVVRGTLTGVAAALIAVSPVTLTPALAAPAAPMMQSSQGNVMGLSGAPNARDLGGIHVDGGDIKAGTVFRSDALNALTSDDQQKLVSAGIVKIIDFRSPTEAAASPDQVPSSIPDEPLPIYDPANDFYVFVSKAIEGGPTVQQQELGDGKGRQIMIDYYKWMVTDATARGQFAATLKEIAGDNGPVMYHCSAGKDRTGWMTAILLQALGASKLDIYANYLESNDLLAASNKAEMDALVAKGLVTDPKLFDPILGVDASFLNAADEQVRQSFGSFDNFLSQGLGIDSGTVSALKAKLLG
ncbi:tyrosine-protein phosphatase [Nocardia sp. NPDC020380]|uniref:tyrosine-protein phosphatase n=1 Tax=Nocardia sp. NPDC020380 TaxID=3364309 RepID=UPI00378AA207